MTSSGSNSVLLAVSESGGVIFSNLSLNLRAAAYLRAVDAGRFWRNHCSAGVSRT